MLACRRRETKQWHSGSRPPQKPKLDTYNTSAIRAYYARFE